MKEIKINSLIQVYTLLLQKKKKMKQKEEQERIDPVEEENKDGIKKGEFIKRIEIGKNLNEVDFKTIKFTFGSNPKEKEILQSSSFNPS